MSRKKALTKCHDDLRRAAGSSSLDEIRSVRQKLMGLMVYALFDRASDELQSIQESTGKAHALLVLKNDWSLQADLRAEAWMLKAASTMAGLAAAAAGRQPKPIDESDRPVRERLLIALRRDNHGELPNNVLAYRADTTEETASRLLDGLRHDGLVETFKRGKRRGNQLTPQGVAAADALLGNSSFNDPMERFDRLAARFREREHDHAYQDLLH